MKKVKLLENVDIGAPPKVEHKVAGDVVELPDEEADRLINLQVATEEGKDGPLVSKAPDSEAGYPAGTTTDETRRTQPTAKKSDSR